ncbi:hypothetical protein SNEBB_009923 [Seison nebaliae]|nr:hypothetical protein SNEBB_009923 [Seison nebaliae]
MGKKDKKESKLTPEFAIGVCVKFIIILCAFINSFTISVYVNTLPLIVKEKKGAEISIGTIETTCSVFLAISSITISKYNKFFNTQHSSPIGLYVHGIATFIFCYSSAISEYWTFMSVTILIATLRGIGNGIFWTVIKSYITNQYFDQLGSLSSSLEFSSGIGLAIGSYFNTNLLKGLSYSSRYWPVGLSEIIFGALLQIFLLVQIAFNNHKNYKSVRREVSKISCGKTPRISKIIRNINVLIVLITIFLSMFAINTIDSTYLLHLKKTKIKNVEKVFGIGFAVSALSYTVLTIPIGFFMDKKKQFTLPFIMAGLLFFSAAFSIIGPAPILHIKLSKYWIYVSSSLMGLALSFIYTPSFVQILKIKNEKYILADDEDFYTRLSGIHMTAIALGLTLGPLCGGIMVRYVSFPKSTFAISCLFLLMMTCICGLWVKECCWSSEESEKISKV